jgi:hypothetical protein
MSSQHHLEFLKGLLVFLDLRKNQYCQKLVFNQFLYFSITYLPYVIYYEMSNDHAHHVLHDARDDVHDAHAFDVRACEGRVRGHDYHCIYRAYVDDFHVNFNCYDDRSSSHKELHFLFSPYLDVQVLIDEFGKFIIIIFFY